MVDNSDFLNRAMSGDLHDIIKERTGLDVRGVINPIPLWEIQQLIEYADRKKRTNAKRLLERAMKQEILKQQLDLRTSFHSDISLIGSTIGNKEPSKGVNDDVV